MGRCWPTNPYHPYIQEGEGEEEGGLQAQKETNVCGYMMYNTHYHKFIIGNVKKAGLNKKFFEFNNGEYRDGQKQRRQDRDGLVTMAR